MAVTPGLRKHSARGSKRAQPAFGLRAEKASVEAVRQTNLFLTQKIGDIRGTDLCSLSNKNFEYEEGANIAYLEETVLRYCQNHNVDFEYKRTGQFWKDILSLFEIVEQGCPDAHEVNLEYSDKHKRFVLVESGYCSFPEYRLFFFPIKFIENLEGDMRMLALTFVEFMKMRCGFSTPYDHFDFCASLGLFDAANWRESEMILEYGEEEFRFVENYNEGSIKSIFNELEKISGNDIEARLRTLLLSVKPKDSWEHRILRAMEEGLSLMEENCLYHYFPDVYSDEEGDYFSDGYIEYERMFCLCYGDDYHDAITDMTINNFNMDIQNLDMMDLKDSVLLTPDSSEAFCPSDFPQKWADWYQQFYELTSLEDE